MLAEAKLTEWIGECKWEKEIDYMLSKVEEIFNHFCIMLKIILGCSQSNFSDKKGSQNRCYIKLAGKI